MTWISIQDTFSLIFRSSPGRSYAIQTTVDLSGWRELTSPTIYDFGYCQRVDVPLDIGAGANSFRISER
jgi:hypothetical protein